MGKELKIRPEIAIYLSIVLLILFTWVFYPIWNLKSINYAQFITPLGFKVYFFKNSFLLISPLTITAIVFMIISAIIPIIWRSSRYSLYASSFSLFLSFIMIINSLIFQQRYLFFHGYSAIPTVTGTFYILFPYKTYFSIPFYLIFVAIAISTLNSVKRARWIPYNRLTLLEKINSDINNKGIITTFSEWFEKFGISYASESNLLKIKDLVLSTEDKKRNLSVFFPSGETIVFGKKYVLYITKEGETKYLNINDGIKLAIAKAIERADVEKTQIKEEKTYL